MSKNNRKFIVLDTSVMLYDKMSLESFPGCDVILPLIVMDELDKFKDKPGSLGENARYINRLLDSLRSISALHTGAPLGDDSTVTIRLVYPEVPPSFPLDVDDSDNRILLEALQIQSANTEKSLVVVTKDINLRVKCDAVGLVAEDYYTDYIDLPEENWGGVSCLTEERSVIDDLYAKHEIDYDTDLSPNSFVVLKTQMGQSVLGAWNAPNNKITHVNDFEVKLGGTFGISGRNKEQKFALWALFNENIPLVTMTGLAGSGKTFSV